MSALSSTPNEALPAIVGHSLTKTYPGGVRALEGVDVRLAPGEITGVIGANGSGKTTLLKILAGWVVPDRGEVRGFVESKSGENSRNSTGFVSQEQALDPEMTGRESVHFFGRMHGTPFPGIEKRTDELLGMFGMSHKADVPVSSYSGGMRQRLHVLLELLHRPRVMFLDEAFSGLDPTGKEVLWGYLEDFSRQGGIVMLTHHELRDVSERCSRVILMAKGKVCAEGSPRDLIARYGQWQWKAVLPRPLEVPDGEIGEKLKAAIRPSSIDVNRESIVLRFRQETVTDAEILSILKSAGVEVHAYERRHPDLADVYRSLTGTESGKPEAPVSRFRTGRRN